MISGNYYEVGDEVVIEVIESAGGKDTYSRQVKMTIVGEASDGADSIFLCYIPCYLMHPRAIRITRPMLRQFQTGEEYLGEQGLIINNWTDVLKHTLRRPGTTCDLCNEFYDYAEPDTYGDFTCYACKEDPYRRSR